MFIRDVLGCGSYASIPPDMVSRVLLRRALVSDHGPRFQTLLLYSDVDLFFFKLQSHIPELETPLSERVRAFVDWLQDNRAFSCMIHVVK